LVLWGASINPQAAAQEGLVDFDISGATSRSANDNTALRWSNGTGGPTDTLWRAFSIEFIIVTAGSNTFTLKYRREGSGTVNFSRRHLIVVPL
jgi:hypothetical protein